MADRVFVLRQRGPSLHRKWQNQFLPDFTQDLSPKSVINLGATADAPDKEGGTYRAYFPNATFKKLDTRPHDDPDYIMGDLMDPNPDHGPYDLVLAMSIIEHIDKPWKAAPVISGLLRQVVIFILRCRGFTQPMRALKIIGVRVPLGLPIFLRIWS